MYRGFGVTPLVALRPYSLPCLFGKSALLQANAPFPKKPIGFSGALPALCARGDRGCDPTSKKWDGLPYSDLYKVCNVNNKPKLLPTERNGAGDRLTDERI